MKRSKRQVFFFIFAMWFFTGCAVRNQQELIIARPSYEKLSFQTSQAQRGDLSAAVSLSLTAEGYDEIVYHTSAEELTLGKIHVSVGDRVKKGDVLVSFQSDVLQQTLADYEDEKRQKELLAWHYENLMAIDEEAGYETDIRMLYEDIEVIRLYMEEAENLLKAYRIVAKEDGIITGLSEYLQNDIIRPDMELLTQITGTGRYLAVVTDADGFAVGDVCFARDGDIEYELCLREILDKTLIFEPVSGRSLLSNSETLTLAGKKQEYKDVVYVDRHAVHTIQGNEGEEDTFCVYIMQENGYQRAVFVTPGERVGENLIIREGLNGGEKVVIR